VGATRITVQAIQFTIVGRKNLCYEPAIQISLGEKSTMPKLVGILWGVLAMRDVANRHSVTASSQNSGSSPLLAYLIHFLHNVQSRHIAQTLMQLDNHMLTDIGLTRGDVEHATHLQFTEDAVDSLAHSRSRHIEDVEQLCSSEASQSVPHDREEIGQISPH
jgi:uncharacterized protein YjiS (DUF1127 family)